MSSKTSVAAGVIAASILVSAAGAYVALSGRESRAVPLTINRPGIGPLYDLDTQIANAEVIVVVRVEEVGAARWNTEDGKLPAGLDTREIPWELTIYREARTQVRQVLKGRPAGNVMLVRTSGGTADGVTVFQEDAPELEASQEYLLFLGGGSTGAGGVRTYWLHTPAPKLYQVRGDKAVSIMEEQPLSGLIAHIRKTVANEDPTGIGDYLRQRYEEWDLPIVSVKVTGQYVEVIYRSDRERAIPTVQDTIDRYRIATEIELARQHGYSIASYTMAAQNESGELFAYAYGPTKPDEEIWLDETPSTLTDAEAENLLREGLDLMSFNLQELSVSSAEGLQTVKLELTTPSVETANEVVVKFVDSLRPWADAVNAQGAHVISVEVRLTDDGGRFLMLYIIDLRTDLFTRWTVSEMPSDWRLPTPTP